MGTPLYVTLSFSLAASKILSLSLILGNVIMMYLVCFLGSNFFGTLRSSGCLFPLPDRGSLASLFVQISFQFLAVVFSFWNPYNSDIGMFQVVPEVPKSHFTFLNSCFFILFWLDVYFFLLFQIIALFPGFLPVTVALFGFISFWVSFICSFNFQPSSISSVSILITRDLNSPSDRLAVSPLLSSF